MLISHEDAMAILIECLRQPDHGNYSNYGYDVYLPSLLTTYLLKKRRVSGADAHQQMAEMISNFYAPAWDLCRRGILRPGIREYGAQATSDGNAGNGYSFTPFGRQWLAEADREIFVPTEPERFARLLGRHENRFGPGRLCIKPAAAAPKHSSTTLLRQFDPRRTRG